MVIRDVLKYGSDILKKNGIDSLDARVLLKFVCGYDEIGISVNSGCELSDELLQKYISYINRRANHEPVAYITGSREFMSLDFDVEPGILIPRPETEHIVEYILDKYSDSTSKKINILDVCTGSGIIAVSLAHYLKYADVTAIDISPVAVKVAKQNAKKHGVYGRVNVLEADALGQYNFGKYFDVVVSNPPYIKSEDVLNLETDVADFEPHIALDGGNDGLAFYRKICQNAFDVLSQNGLLVFEIGYDQGNDIRSILSEKYTKIEVLKDFAGNDRVALAQKIDNGDYI